ncbi:MAG: sulfur transferase domain-containing protein [Leptolyngbya sp. BL-A-14]
MKKVRKITNELAIAGQPTPDVLQHLAEEGYRSVVNLRSPHENGFLDDERQKAEYLGLHYANVPIQLDTLNLDNVLQVIQQLTTLPKPMLMHCDSGIRSSIVVLMQLSMEQGIKAEDAFQKVANLGLLSNRFYVKGQAGGSHVKSNHKSDASTHCGGD